MQFLQPTLRNLHTLTSFHMVLLASNNDAQLQILTLAVLQNLPTAVKELHLYYEPYSSQIKRRQLEQIASSYSKLEDVYLHFHRHFVQKERDLWASKGGKAFHVVDWDVKND